MAKDYPVVLLPGLMGSCFRLPESDKDWNPDDSVGMFFDWEFLVWDEEVRQALHWSQQANLYYGNPKGWSAVSDDYHGYLRRKLEQSGEFPGVFAMGYDWRQRLHPNAETNFSPGKLLVDYFTKVLKDAGNKTKLDVIAYSMGSLLLRCAVVEVGKNLTDLIRRVIFITPPSVGAVVLYRRLFTGMYSRLDGSSISENIFQDILGNDREAFLGSISGLPGPIQLLPTEHYPVNQYGKHWHPYLDTYPHAGMYAHPNSPPGIAPSNIGLDPDVLADLKIRIDDQKNFEAHLGNPGKSTIADSWLIYSHGLMTDTKFDPNNWYRPERRGTGDQTVDRLSALALGVPAANVVNDVTDVKHADACTSGHIAFHVLDILAKP